MVLSQSVLQSWKHKKAVLVPNWKEYYDRNYRNAGLQIQPQSLVTMEIRKKQVSSSYRPIPTLAPQQKFKTRLFIPQLEEKWLKTIK